MFQLLCGILTTGSQTHRFLLSALAEVCNNSKKRKEGDNCVLQLLCYVLRQKLYTVCYKKSGTNRQCKNRYENSKENSQNSSSSAVYFQCFHSQLMHITGVKQLFFKIHFLVPLESMEN